MKKIFIATILLAIIGFTILFFLFAERKRLGELELKELKEDFGAFNKNSKQGYVQICINKSEGHLPLTHYVVLC